MVEHMVHVESVPGMVGERNGIERHSVIEITGLLDGRRSGQGGLLVLVARATPEVLCSLYQGCIQGCIMSLLM